MSKFLIICLLFLIHDMDVNDGIICLWILMVLFDISISASIAAYWSVVIHGETQTTGADILWSQEPGSKIIIFCSTKKMRDQLAYNLTRQFGAVAIRNQGNNKETQHSKKIQSRIIEVQILMVKWLVALVFVLYIA